MARKKAPSALSDQELLAVLLGKGTHQMDVMMLAAKVARAIDDLHPREVFDRQGFRCDSCPQSSVWQP